MLKTISRSHWNFETAAHLLNRAGFGGTPKEIEELAKLGPEKAVSKLVDFEKTPDPTENPSWAKPDPDRLAKFQEAQKLDEEKRREKLREIQREQRQQSVELRHWWLERMTHGTRPFQEKMTLFWHGHFATSIEKVREPYLMWRQNELFRRLATANWLQLLTEVARDPAMLVWLDQAQSRKEHPNENFAREVMELFALGEGYYTEKDITEAARALTGWSFDRFSQRFVEKPSWHDEGTKTVLGRTGNLDGKDFLETIVKQPQAAKFITTKLWKFFASEDVSNELADALADVFRKADNNFKPLMRTILLSEEFYSPGAMKSQVKSPVQWLVGSVKMLERELPIAQICFGLTRNLGQDLFAPPNVKGWDGGLTWITTNNLLARYNQAAVLVQGDMTMAAGIAASVIPNQNAGAMRQIENRVRNIRGIKVDVAKILTGKERTDKDALVAALEKRLLQSKLKPKQERALRDYLDSQGDLDDGDILGAIRLVMSTPEFQLT